VPSSMVTSSVRRRVASCKKAWENAKTPMELRFAFPRKLLCHEIARTSAGKHDNGNIRYEA
jgi:hypothetical protein